MVCYVQMMFTTQNTNWLYVTNYVSQIIQFLFKFITQFLNFNGKVLLE